MPNKYDVMDDVHDMLCRSLIKAFEDIDDCNVARLTFDVDLLTRSVMISGYLIPSEDDDNDNEPS